jgi:hypothetical protein
MNRIGQILLCLPIEILTFHSFTIACHVFMAMKDGRIACPDQGKFLVSSCNALGVSNEECAALIIQMADSDILDRVA